MSEARDTRPVEVELDRRRPYRVRDEDRDAIWVGPGRVSVPAWVAEAWGMVVETPAPPAIFMPVEPTEPWDGYAALTVREVVKLLPDLDERTRAAVIAWETAQGKRKGVLEALGEAW